MVTPCFGTFTLMPDLLRVIGGSNWLGITLKCTWKTARGTLLLQPISSAVVPPKAWLWVVNDVGTKGNGKFKRTKLHLHYMAHFFAIFQRCALALVALWYISAIKGIAIHLIYIKGYISHITDPSVFLLKTDGILFRLKKTVPEFRHLQYSFLINCTFFQIWQWNFVISFHELQGWNRFQTLPILSNLYSGVLHLQHVLLFTALAIQMYASVIHTCFVNACVLSEPWFAQLDTYSYQSSILLIEPSIKI